MWQNGRVDPDAVGGGEWGRSRDACIRWGWLPSKGKEQFGVNLRRPIVTNETLWRSCGKLRESIVLSFGVVSGVGRSTCVLEGVHVPQGANLRVNISSYSAE